MRHLMPVLPFLLLGACSQAPSPVGPVGPDVPSAAVSAPSIESLQSTQGAGCKVTLEHIPAPPDRGMAGIKRWFRATYSGRACYEGKQWLYYPAPQWEAWPNGPSAMMYGGDHFVGYLWPNVTCCMVVTIRATAPNGSYAEMAYRIPDDDF